LQKSKKGFGVAKLKDEEGVLAHRGGASVSKNTLFVFQLKS
jgi:hypothetical protein